MQEKRPAKVNLDTDALGFSATTQSKSINIILDGFVALEF